MKKLLPTIFFVFLFLIVGCGEEPAQPKEEDTVGNYLKDDMTPMDRAAFVALELSEAGNTDLALSMLDSTIADFGAAPGHPALAFVYSVKRVIYIQRGQEASAEQCQQLVNARLEPTCEHHINKRLMDIYMKRQDYELARQYAVAYGATSDMAQGSEYEIEVTESRARIADLTHRVHTDGRQKLWLSLAVLFVALASLGVILYIRKQKRRQLSATRRELQSRMAEQVTALQNRMEQQTEEATSLLREELLANHALVLRINNVAHGGKLTADEEELLHRVTDMLFDGFTQRLQSLSAIPLTKREITICCLIRFGIPQRDICTLLDWKSASLRVSKSRLKRDRFCLPTEVELETFLAEL